MKFPLRRNHGHESESMEIDDAVLTLTEKSAAKIEWPLNRAILSIMFGGMALILLVGLGGRIFYLNVVKGAEYQERAERNSLRAEVIPAPRGIIYDRYGKPLVHNAPSIDLVLFPREIPDTEGQEARLKETLRTLFALDDPLVNELFEKMDRNSRLPYLVKERLTQEETLKFLARSQDLPSVRLYKTMHRQYEDGMIFSHVLGYEGKIRKEELELNPDYLLVDSIGKQGIEKSYEKELRGIHGYNRSEVDAYGQEQKNLGAVPATPGSDLILNIDADLQKKIFDSLHETLERAGLSKGAAVALDPRSGAVRALVSLPSFDNNLFAQGIKNEDYQILTADPNQPLFNRAVAGEYPPGSTVKPALAVGALEEGVVDEHTQIESRGGISVGSTFFGDWKTHGFTDIRRAIAVSSDVFFYSIGGGYGNIRGLGMDLMKKYYNLFGYGEKTGIDMGGEAKGQIPDPQWKERVIGERWYIGNSYHASIGQGFVTATPLQIANSIAAIVNGGTLYAPRVVGQVRTADGATRPVPPEVLREDIADPKILQIVREGMRQTVESGTAMSLNTLSVPVAGKSGTAQFGADDKTHGWFVSFAPYDNPELVLLILAEGQGTEGYNTVPVTKEVYEWYFNRTAEKP